MYDDELDDFDADDDHLDSGEGDSGDDDDAVDALQLIHDLAASHSGVRCSQDNL